MKIAWYTPFSATSAIGHFSHMVVRELRRLDIEVLIVRSETRNAEIRACPPTCRQEKWAWATDFDRNPTKQLKAYDLVIYNIGDHYDFHAYCYSHQRMAPGLTILHDYSLHNAANHFCHDTAPANGTYCDHLRDEQGDQAVAAFEAARAAGDGSVWWQDQAAQFPIYRWAMRETLGVITHADFYREAVSRSLGCPVAAIPLAYDSPCHPNEARNRANASREGKLTLLTVGAVNRNKRYESVIRAIAGNAKLRDRIQFRIVGGVSDTVRDQIEQTCDKEQHRPDVTLTGYVDRESLRQELANADAISCLRYPALEGASASVIEGLLTGKPVITSHTGCYAEIPNELVHHVSPDNEISDLTAALCQIVDNYETEQQRAARARVWALQRHSADAYVRQLIQFIPTVLYDQPVLALLERMADRLVGWNLKANNQLLGRIDDAILTMFGSSSTEDRAKAA